MPPTPNFLNRACAHPAANHDIDCLSVQRQQRLAAAVHVMQVPIADVLKALGVRIIDCKKWCAAKMGHDDRL